MSIITISRGSSSRGKEVAEKVAEKLGYKCVSREALLDASKEWDIPEIKLIRAIHDAPSVFHRFTYGRDKYIAFIRCAVLKQLQADDAVYHGLAGPYFVTGVSHALKVRIIADQEERVKLVMERDGVSKKNALAVLKKDDAERRNWGRKLYGIDTSDASLYDLVVNTRNIPVDEAVNIICDAAGLDRFKTSPESQRSMDDLVLAAEVKAALVNLKPDIEVSAGDGVVEVRTRATESAEESLFQKMKEVATALPGVGEFKVHFLPISPYGMKSTE